jgi:MFS family permease
VAANAAWRTVWLLALVSFINDISGEMLMAVLPFFLIAQGATGLGLGLVGGVTEGVGHMFKLVGGYIGTRAPSKKLLIGAGYAVSSLSRFGVAFATLWPVTLAFRSLDKVGKGLRTAPRDALLADSVTFRDRGRAFGLHRAADTAGAVVGVLIVLAALVFFGASSSQIILAGAGIAMLSLIPLFFVQEPSAESLAANPIALREPMSKRYGVFLAVSAVFFLSRVTYLFYLVRSTDAGTGITAAVAWYLVFNIVYTVLAYPAGRFGDNIGKRQLLLAGYVLTAVAAAMFIVPPGNLTLATGFVLLGASFAAVEGTSRAFAADLAGSRSRSSRLGEFHAITGMATLIGGIAAGLLWDNIGPEAAFVWGVVLPLVAALGLLWVPDPKGPLAAPAA